MLPNSLQYPVYLFGTLLVGAIVVNVNLLYAVPGLAHQLRDSSTRTTIVLKNFMRTLGQTLPSSQMRSVVTTGVGDLMGDALNLKSRALNLVMRHVQKQMLPYKLPPPVWLRDALAVGGLCMMQPVQLVPEGVVFLRYTSGTIGVTKGAMLTHRNITANLLQAEEWSKSMLNGGAEANVTLLPLCHIFSLTANLLMFMVLGRRNTLIVNPRDTKRVIFILHNERFSGIAGVSTLFNALLEDPDFATRNLSAMKITIGGGMAVQCVIVQRRREATGHTVVEGYGLTEYSPVVSMNPSYMTEFSGMIGLPVPSTEVRFKCDDGTIAPLDKPGESQVRGSQVVRGYRQHPEETAKSIGAEGQFSTGDIGVMDANSYIRLINRKKDMILVLGFNVYSNEIEDVVALHPDMLEVAAAGVPDLVAGGRVKIIVAPCTGVLTEPALLEHCCAHPTSYKMPHIVESRHEELPKSIVGKILHRGLRGADPGIKRAHAQAQ